MAPSPKVSTIINFPKSCPFSNPFCHHMSHNHLQLVLPLHGYTYAAGAALNTIEVPLIYLILPASGAGGVAPSPKVNTIIIIIFSKCNIYFISVRHHKVRNTCSWRCHHMHLNHNNNQFMSIFVPDCYQVTMFSFSNTLVDKKPFKGRVY